jgi:hypothetical protein
MVIHTIPSVACWIANKKGIKETGNNFLVRTFFIVAIPHVASAALAIKLAFAEKHIHYPYIFLSSLFTIRNTILPMQECNYIFDYIVDK